MVCGTTAVGDRRVYQLANVRTGRHPGKAYVPGLLALLVSSDRVAIYGGTVSVLRPDLGKRVFMLVERFVRFSDRAKRCPDVVILI